MSRRFINQIADGESIDESFLLIDKQIRVNRNGAQYLLAELRDRTGSLSARMWNVGENDVAHVQPGNYVRARGKAQLFQGAIQMILTSVVAIPAESVQPEDFQRAVGKDVLQLITDCRESVARIVNTPIRQLLQLFLDDGEFLAQFSTAPAGLKAHHCYRGGLLDHVVNMLHVAERIEDLYPGIDHSLLRAGIFLHDMGKIHEMSLETGIYTDEGQLLGHLVIAVDMLGDKVRVWEETYKTAFPYELLLRLKHLIISHHGTYEFGSPKLPMTPEAIALHHLDNLDAKVHEFSRDIADDPNSQSSWTPFNSRLDRKLFKGIRTPPASDAANPAAGTAANPAAGTSASNEPAATNGMSTAASANP